MFNLSAAVFVYKALNQLTHTENDYFIRNDPMYNLRNNADLQIHRNSSTQSQLFFKYRAAKTWNSITTDIRTSRSIGTFKRKLKLHLFELVRAEFIEP